MTALRIFRTAKPSLIGAPVQPMSKIDADFWRLRSAASLAGNLNSRPGEEAGRAGNGSRS